MRLSKKRSRAIKSSPDDPGKESLVRCWNCNFPIDLTKVSTGRGSGVIHNDFIFEEQNIRSSGDPNKVMLIANKQGGLGAVLEDDIIDRDSQLAGAYYTPRVGIAVGGCPLCGTKNLP